MQAFALCVAANAFSPQNQSQQLACSDVQCTEGVLFLLALIFIQSINLPSAENNHQLNVQKTKSPALMPQRQDNQAEQLSVIAQR